jgi:hypothetical protein
MSDLTKGIIYYTDSRLDSKIAEAVRKQLLSIGLPIVSASLEPLDFGKNFHVKMKRGYEAYFTQILTCLENSDSDIVFFCEHDNLMHPSHFDFTPHTKDKFYYDLNWFKVRSDGLAVHWDAVQVSGLCCYRELAIKYYRERLAKFDPDNFDRKFEPTVGIEYETWWAEYPSIDIRHDSNLTYNKWKLEHFRDKSTAKNFKKARIDDIEGWDTERLKAIL